MNLLTISDGIAGLTVTGVTILKVNEIPLAIDIRSLPTLIPDPNNPVSNFNLTRQSYGLNSEAAYDADYQLNYNLIYKPVGTGRNTLEAIAGAIEAAVDVVDTVLASGVLTGAATYDPVIGQSAIINVGGVEFHSVPISFRITEIVK